MGYIEPKRLDETGFFRKMDKLEAFLAKKPLYYDKIDLERMPKAWESIKEHIKLPKIIHIIGTNGKGSTGRFLAHYLHRAGFSIGHYTSPHIVKFNERIWINGSDVSDERLEEAHKKLSNTLSTKYLDTLSYFEYTTLLAIYIYQECDYLVLEAGLGGEHDATTVFKNIMTLVTTIGVDHTSFLGNTIKEIASTKLKAVQKKAIISKQKQKEVYSVADELAIEWSRAEELINDSDTVEIKNTISKLNLPKIFEKNLTLAVAGVRELGFDEIDFENFKDIGLHGRAERIAPNVTIDVGHNPLAAEALANHFKNKKVTLVYNSFSDKDYESVLRILKPIIDEVQIIEIDNQRALKKRELESTLKRFGVKYSYFKSIEPNREYLVFGSFSVVESFIDRYFS